MVRPPFFRAASIRPGWCAVPMPGGQAACRQNAHAIQPSVPVHDSVKLQCRIPHQRSIIEDPHRSSSGRQASVAASEAARCSADHKSDSSWHQMPFYNRHSSRNHALSPYTSATAYFLRQLLVSSGHFTAHFETTNGTICNPRTTFASNTARIALTKLPVLRIFMPFIIIPLFMLHSSPATLCAVFATGVITPIFFIFILIPCVVERFFIDILT